MTKKLQAKQLASYGRNGDSMLVHMSQREFDALNNGLGSLTGKGATVNPETGLPEMFNWTSLIPAVVGIGASVLSGGTLSPLAAGMISGATTTAVTGDWRQGLTAGILGGAASGLGAGASEMMGGAGSAAAGAGVDAGMQMGGVMADTATASMADQALAGAATEGLGSAFATAPVDAAMSAAATDGLTAGMTDATMAQGMNEGLGALGSQAGTTGASFQDAFMGDKFMSRTVPGLMGAGQSIMSGIEPETYEPTSEGDDAPTTYQTMSREYTPADPSYTVAGGEPMMFSDPIYETHNFAQGGLASLNGDQDMVSTKRARQLRGRYRSKKAVIDDLNRPNSYAKELGVTGPDDPILSVAFGFTAKQGRKNKSLSPAFAGGGRVEKQDPANYMDMPRQSRNKIADPFIPIPGDYKPKKFNDEVNHADKFSDEMDNGKSIPNVYTVKKRRVQMAGGGHVQGAGDGMSDDIMTSIEGMQPAALSNDEYVMPADAVSDLGNGSSQAGAAELDNMVARIRQMRHGTTEQPPRVDPRKVMPA